mmetsp:Transcript_23287/g.72826  ORF Transcript_23287/g.72826 Transcript_23287/m.72826 type:complete len:207 (+) Transcript_23287:384-1004(+)
MVSTLSVYSETSSALSRIFSSSRSSGLSRSGTHSVKNVLSATPSSSSSSPPAAPAPPISASSAAAGGGGAFAPPSSTLICESPAGAPSSPGLPRSMATSPAFGAGNGEPGSPAADAGVGAGAGASTTGAAITAPRMASRRCSDRFPRRCSASTHGRQKLSSQSRHRTTAAWLSHSMQSSPRGGGSASSMATGSSAMAPNPSPQAQA